MFKIVRFYVNKTHIIHGNAYVNGKSDQHGCHCNLLLFHHISSERNLLKVTLEL